MAGADAERCAALAEEALADDVLIAADPGFFPVAALMVLTMADREQAVSEWEKLRVLGHRRGSLFGMVSVNLWSGLTLLWRGDLREAQERLEAAHEQFADWGRTRSRVTYGAAFLGDVRRLRGDLAGARAILDIGLAEDDGSDGFAQLLRSRTTLLLEEGKFAEALEQTWRLEEHDATISSFPGWLPWRALRARALAGLGSSDDALPLARQEVDVARRFGPPASSGARCASSGRSIPTAGSSGCARPSRYSTARPRVSSWRRRSRRWGRRCGSPDSRPRLAIPSDARSSSRTAAAPTGWSSALVRSCTRRARGRARRSAPASAR